MAWNKPPKTQNRPKPQLDQFDLEAEAEANAMKGAPGIIGPKGKRLKGGHSGHDPRGLAIAEQKATRHIKVTAA